MMMSIVIPLLNEAKTLSLLFQRLGAITRQLDCDYEIIFVNDGSTDETPAMLAEAAKADSHLKVLSFSRRFGHQVAITAGMDFASGEAVVVMDGDLQDPPELLPELLRLYRAGYDIVSPQRVDRQSDTVFKRLTASFFYWVMRRMVDRRLVPEVGDFRLFSARTLVAIRQLREQHRFMRGLVAWLGLKEAIVPFERQARLAGETKYSLWRMLAFAWTAITSFSGLPLKISLVFGLILTALGSAGALWVTYETLFHHGTAPGWSSLIVVQCVFSGAILISVGLLGDYVARVYEEAKSRPLYVVTDMVNLAYEGQNRRAVILPPVGFTGKRASGTSA